MYREGNLPTYEDFFFYDQKQDTSLKTWFLGKPEFHLDH